MGKEGRLLELHLATRHQICVIRETLYTLSTLYPSPFVRTAANAGIAIEYIGVPAVHFNINFQRFYFFYFSPSGPVRFRFMGDVSDSRQNRLKTFTEAEQSIR
jgi:hypothetical protein